MDFSLFKTAPKAPGAGAAPSGLEMMALSFMSKLGIDPQQVFAFIQKIQAVVGEANERLGNIEKQNASIIELLSGHGNIPRGSGIQPGDTGGFGATDNAGTVPRDDTGANV